MDQCRPSDQTYILRFRNPIRPNRTPLLETATWPDQNQTDSNFLPNMLQLVKSIENNLLGQILQIWYLWNPKNVYNPSVEINHNGTVQSFEMKIK
jgi:hypothetical protein